MMKHSMASAALALLSSPLIFIFSFTVVFVPLAMPSSALAAPAEVLIIRHAEKPSEDADTARASMTALDAGRNLSPRGYQRAQALVALFTQDARFLEFGLPVAIYAGSPKHADRGSLRPLQTIAPLAATLNLKPNTSFESPDFEDMVADVMKNKAFEGKMVLISWPHDQIRDMAVSFGVDKSETSKWHGDTFDRVWKIQFDKGGNVKSFDDLPQHVLPGDSVN